MPKISPIPAKQLRRIFEKDGFKCVRSKGDHFVFTKEGVARPIIIPDWPEVPVFVIKNNLRSVGLSRDEYFDLLKKS